MRSSYSDRGVSWATIFGIEIENEMEMTSQLCRVLMGFIDILMLSDRGLAASSRSTLVSKLDMTTITPFRFLIVFVVRLNNLCAGC